MLKEITKQDFNKYIEGLSQKEINEKILKEEIIIKNINLYSTESGMQVVIDTYCQYFIDLEKIEKNKKDLKQLLDILYTLKELIKKSVCIPDLIDKEHIKIYWFLIKNGCEIRIFKNNIRFSVEGFYKKNIVFPLNGFNFIVFDENSSSEMDINYFTILGIFFNELRTSCVDFVSDNEIELITKNMEI